MNKKTGFVRLLSTIGVAFGLLGCSLSSLIPVATQAPPAVVTKTATVRPLPEDTRTTTATYVEASLTPFPPVVENTLPDMDIYASGLTPSQQEKLNEMEGATVYEIHLLIPADYEVLHGQQRVYYTNREQDLLDKMVFYLYPNKVGGETNIRSVQVNGVDSDWQLSLEGLVMEIPLSPELQPGEKLQVDLVYDVRVPREMGGNYGLFGYFTHILVLDQFYPLVPMYDSQGWRIREIPPNADVTFNDVSFYHVYVEAPESLVVVGSGVEVGSSRQDGQQRIEIVSGPARDFYLAASEDFQVISDQWGDTRIHSYTTAENAEGAQFVLETAKNALRIFSERLDEYPYTEFDIISTSMEALGMEYPGIVAISQDLYPADGMMYGSSTRQWLESVVVHETAHQWFYNLVGNDQIDEPWVDESVVQYVTSLYYLDQYGESAAEAYRQEWYGRWDRVDRAAIPIGMSAGQYSSTEYSAIVYGRGAIFVKTLEEQMGADVFDEFLRDYVLTKAWQTASAVEFKEMAEAYCGCDLSGMWSEWIEE